MHRNLLVVALCCVAASVFGCTRESQKPANTPPKVVSVHGAGADSKQSNQPQGFVGIVSSQNLPLSNTKTIGAAFNEYRYFSSREWKETRNASGKAYVGFRGMLTGGSSGQNGLSRQGVEVKFVVNQTGDLFVAMVSRIDAMADGTMRFYPLEDGSRIVELIYANKEISF